jgi:tetratricopeptide (TPR) repeat protein
MKVVKVVLLSLLILCETFANAQTQQGVVKTRGKMVNGKLVSGIGLSGATVTIQGRSAVLSQGSGAFSFPVTNKTFLVQSVQKQGYQLVDADATRKTYQYSPNTFYLVMDTPDQQVADKLAAERKIRRTLQRQLQQREDEIEALNASTAVKDSLLRILYQQQGDNEMIISDMAKRYASLDYDQLDEFYRKVNDLIENGELTRADSMLRSRGDIKTQVEAILQQGQSIKEQESQLQKAKTVQQTEVEEAARRCYAYYESFQQQHMVDSAVHYLKLRAVLDTTNVKWQYDVGMYLHNYIGHYHKSITVYELMLRQSLLQYGEDDEWTAAAYNNLGFCYSVLGDSSKALDYYSKALNIREKIFGMEHPDVGQTYNNLGMVYYRQGNYPLALEYFYKDLAILIKMYGNKHPDIALSFNNIGSAYREQGDYSKAFEYYFKALDIQKESLGVDHPDMAISYDNIGAACYSQGDYAKALEYHQKSLAIFEKVLGANHPDVATSYKSIGSVYLMQGDYPRALEYYEKALSIDEKVFGVEHPYTISGREDIESIKVKMEENSK